jgi:NADH-quinone oxidoreductase subunit N
MALSLIVWAPEVFLCTILLYILFYGTGPVVNIMTESWFVIPVSANSQSSPKVTYSVENSVNNSLENGVSRPVLPDAGPSISIVAHLSLLVFLWCLLGSVLIWSNPFYCVMAGGVFVIDSFSQIVNFGLLFYASLCLLCATMYMENAKIIHTEYLMLVMLSILGMVLLVYTADLMSLYLCLELQSFALVVLCSLNTKNHYTVEAGMKYFLLSAFSSCLLLLGIGLIYWETGLTKISLLRDLFLSLDSSSTSISALLAIWLISLGLLWKLAAAPLHFWAADVYMGALSSVTLLMSTLPKIAVLAFWVHHWHVLWSTFFSDTLFWFSSISLVIGAVAPLAQVHLKRLLAFSSIGHMGFMLMPLVGGSEGLAALWVYLMFYCLTSLVVWGLLMWPYNRSMHFGNVVSKYSNDSSSMFSGTYGPIYIWDLCSLNLAVPAAATAWAIAMLSLAGLPPAAGFVGKLGLFWWGLNQNMYILVYIALLSTLLSSVYYLRLLKVAYIDQNPTKGWGVSLAISPVTAYVISGAVFVLSISLWHSAPFVLTAHYMTL